MAAPSNAAAIGAFIAGTANRPIPDDVLDAARLFANKAASRPN